MIYNVYLLIQAQAAMLRVLQSDMVEAVRAFEPLQKHDRHLATCFWNAEVEEHFLAWRGRRKRVRLPRLVRRPPRTAEENRRDHQ